MTSYNKALPTLKLDDFPFFSKRRRSLHHVAPESFQPVAAHPAVALTLPFDWSFDPYRDRNWRFNLQAWRMFDPIWRRLRHGSHRLVQEEILAWMANWYHFHVELKQDSSFAWYDMAVGNRAQHLAAVLHLCSQGIFVIPDPQSKMLEELARLHLRKLLNPSFISTNNHAISQVTGLRLLGMAWHNKKECGDEATYSTALMRRILDTQFDRNGIHTENSPSYHSYAIRRFGLIKPEWFPSLRKHLCTILMRAEEHEPWFTMSNGRIAMIGDSAGRGSPHTGRESFTKCARDTLGRDILFKDLKESGYVVCRTSANEHLQRSSMLIVNGQALTPYHAHCDHLGFELFEHGREIFVDSGKFSYQTDEWRKYFVSAAAHNVVTLAGIDTLPKDRLTQGSAIRKASMSDNGCTRIAGVIARSTHVHRRSFIYRPGESLVLEDHLETTSDAPAIHYLQLAPTLRAEVRDGLIWVFDKAVPVCTIKLSIADYEARFITGQVTPYIGGWRSYQYLRKVPATTIALTIPPQKRQFSTHINFIKPALDANPLYSSSREESTGNPVKANAHLSNVAEPANRVAETEHYLDAAKRSLPHKVKTHENSAKANKQPPAIISPGELLLGLLEQPSHYWPGNTRQANKLSGKVSKLRATSGWSCENICLAALQAAAWRLENEQITYYLSSVGSSGSHLIQHIIAGCVPCLPLGEIYISPSLVPIVQAWPENRDRHLFMEAYHLVHAGTPTAFARQATAIINTAHKSTLSPYSCWTKRFKSMLITRRPEDIAISRTFRKQSYRDFLGMTDASDNDYLQLNIKKCRSFFANANKFAYDCVLKFEDAISRSPAAAAAILKFCELPATRLASVAKQIDRSCEADQGTTRYRGPAVPVAEHYKESARTALADIAADLGYT
jgi:hypothetical protein